MHLVPTRRGTHPLWMYERRRGWSWWILVPHPIQSWFVGRANACVCAQFGHDDFAWHLRDAVWPGTASPIVDELRCGNCSAIIDGCTGGGVGNFHPIQEAS